MRSVDNSISLKKKSGHFCLNSFFLILEYEVLCVYPLQSIQKKYYIGYSHNPEERQSPKMKNIFFILEPLTILLLKIQFV
jgi:hypothetical protein